jgi:hypothetical protein
MIIIDLCVHESVRSYCVVDVQNVGQPGSLLRLAALRCARPVEASSLFGVL